MILSNTEKVTFMFSIDFSFFEIFNFFHVSAFWGQSRLLSGLEAGGKKSTWFPPGELVELSIARKMLDCEFSNQNEGLSCC